MAHSLLYLVGLVLVVFCMRGAYINFYYRTRELKLSQGTILGRERSAFNGDLFYGFTSIPYAKPPVGDLRFKRPEPPESWADIRLPQSVPKCVQHDHVMLGRTSGQEDCLYLNVFTKWKGMNSDHPEDASLTIDLLPVMIYIHGGGFMAGSSSEMTMGPDLLLQEDIVLVTINYRLGPLGFLSMGDDTLPGNLGLWDQIMAFKWVQENIRIFGGDPARVTLAGSSAGAFSVNHHIFSPRSKGLFHRGIMSSGVSSSAYSNVNKHPAYYARTLADLVGCDPEAESSQVVECLREVPAEDLAVKATQVLNVTKFVPYPFQPVLDNFTTAGTEFFPKDPWDLLQEGSFNKDVQMMMGNAKYEGLVFMKEFLATEDKGKKRLKEMFSDPDIKVPMYMNLRESDETDSASRRLGREALKLYFDRTLPDLATNDGIHRLSQMMGDPTFNIIGTMTARQMAKNTPQPVYEYLYTHEGTLSLTDILIGGMGTFLLRLLLLLLGWDPLRKNYGPCHSDETGMLFSLNGFHPALHTEDDILTSRNLVTLFTNFAKSGDPNSALDHTSLPYKWKRLTENNLEVLKINASPKSGAHSEDHESRVSFWQRIFVSIPATIHNPLSTTWTKPKVYYKKSESQHAQDSAKEEL